jgi:transcriptional regulator with XRE-family HTH domain
MKRNKRKLKIFFGQNLKILRTQKGLSQGELADVLDTTNISISNYELGKTLPQKPMREKIAKLFDKEDAALLLPVNSTEQKPIPQNSSENATMNFVTKFSEDPKERLQSAVYQAILGNIITPEQLFSTMLSAMSVKNLREAEISNKFNTELHGLLHIELSTPYPLKPTNTSSTNTQKKEK